MSLTRPLTIVSELPNRMRLKGRFLRDPDLDPDYLEATLEIIPGCGIGPAQQSCLLPDYPI